MCPLIADDLVLNSKALQLPRPTKLNVSSSQIFMRIRQINWEVNEMKYHQGAVFQLTLTVSIEVFVRKEQCLCHLTLESILPYRAVQK